LTWRGKRSCDSISGPSAGHRRGGRRRPRAARRAGCPSTAPPPRPCRPRPGPAATARSRPSRARLQAAGVERHAACSNTGWFMSTVTRPSSLQVQLQQVVDGLDPDAAPVGQAALVHVAHEAARAVAAMFDLVAAVVEDAVAEVHARRAAGFDHQDLVGAHAEAAVAQVAHLRRVSCSGARVASSTTKSLPAPCILVKRSFMAGLSAHGYNEGSPCPAAS
jgi:hypothetical protein